MFSARKVKDLATQLESLRLSWGNLWTGDHMLSWEDSKRMYLAYMFWLELAKDTSFKMVNVVQNYVSQPGSFRDEASKHIIRGYEHLSLKKLTSEDVSVVMDTFKVALLVLRHIPTNRDITSYDTAVSTVKRLYKQYGGQVYSVAWGLIKPFIASVILYQDSNLFKHTNCLIQYMLRVTLRDVEWILEEEIQKYKDFEEVLHNQEYNPDVVSELSDIVTEWFQDWDATLPELVDELQAEHGYGATAEVRRSQGTAAKYRNVHMTLEARNLAKVLNWTPLPHIWPGLSQEAYLSHYLMKHKSQLLKHSWEFTGVIQLVPKGTDKKRVVSKEPTTNQFFQKKVGKLLDFYMSRRIHTFHVNLHDQGVNRRLALEGSIDGSYATIDLSSASDSVTWTLVQSIFRNVPSLLRLLEWCRTRQVQLPDRSIIGLEKFAPMGAGTCFPIECIVFSSVVAAVLKRHGKHARYWVYGDDIVVPSWAYQEVIDLLTSLHFIPNDTKSYGHGSLFTESCGIECFRGHDVSPIRVSRKWDPISRENGIRNASHLQLTRRHITRLYSQMLLLLRKLHSLSSGQQFLNYFLLLLQKQKQRDTHDRNIGSTQLQAYYKMANDAEDYGYANLAESLRNHACQLFDKPIWSNNHIYGFFTANGVDVILKNWYNMRWNASTQSYDVLCDNIRVETEPGEDDLRYSKVLEALSTTRRRQLIDPEDLVTADCGAARTSMKLVRVPFRELVSSDSEINNFTESKEDYYVTQGINYLLTV